MDQAELTPVVQAELTPADQAKFIPADQAVHDETEGDQEEDGHGADADDEDDGHGQLGVTGHEELFQCLAVQLRVLKERLRHNFCSTLQHIGQNENSC